jgi:hypothetical protein
MTGTEIEQAVIQGLEAMKLSAGGDPSAEVMHAGRRDKRSQN